jgi:hypothetical protein
MEEKNIIKKETKEGNGIYIIEIDKEKASTIKGDTYTERVNNAIKDLADRSDKRTTTREDNNSKNGH